MSIPFILTSNSLSFVLGNKPYVIPASHQNWDKLVDAFNQGADGETIEPLVEIAQSVVNFMNGEIQIVDGVLFYRERELNNHLTRRILQHLEAQQPGLADPLIALLAKSLENPSYRAVDGLYEWLEVSNLPITPDGEVIAYKIVGEDYRDLHSGRFDHRPGNVVEQPRNQCDENPDQTCSAGLHFCSAGYLPHYGNSPGNRVVIVKIHPRDVVAFPRDYGIAKGRCCRMEVVGEVDRETAASVFRANLVAAPADIRPELAVGQKWMTRDGDIVVIESFDDNENNTFPWETECGRTYTKEGTYYEGEENPSDLVKFLGYDV